MISQAGKKIIFKSQKKDYGMFRSNLEDINNCSNVNNLHRLFVYHCKIGKCLLQYQGETYSESL